MISACTLCRKLRPCHQLFRRTVRRPDNSIENNRGALHEPRAGEHNRLRPQDSRALGLMRFVGSMLLLSARLGAADSAATLLIEAYNPDGTRASVTDFVNYTHYVSSSKWTMYQNYGVFPMGTAPAMSQIGSDVTSTTRDGVPYLAFSVPINRPLYFTALWKAPGIGTVFMRADNSGGGYLLANNQSQILQLPYEFAASEYNTANQMFASYAASGHTWSGDASNALAQASAALETAKNASAAPSRAIASYQALARIIPLKERLVLEMSDAAIAKNGYRPDFVLNYEGIGSWVNTRFVPGYNFAKSAGFSAVLTVCDWSTISPTQGVYNFSALDYQVSQAAALGYSIALNVNPGLGNMMPAWAAKLSFEDLKPLYYENARRVVDRYKDKVAVIYPVTEIELANTAKFTLPQLAELARQSLNGARAAAPSMAFGIYMSASAYIPYQMNVVANPTYVSGWDMLNYYSANNIKFDFLGLEMQYGTVFAPIDLQRVQELLLSIYSVAKVPIYMGETGYSSKTEDYSIEASSYWHEGLTQHAQAGWANGFLRICYALPFLKGFYWVHLDPDDNDYGSDFLSSLIGTNLFRPDGSPKTAYSAFQQFTSTMASTSPLAAFPASGTGASQAMSFVFNDPRGWQDLDVVNVLIGSALDARTACYLAYSRSTSTLYLVDDEGTKLLPGMALSAGGVGLSGPQNHQCGVISSGTSVTGSGNALSVTLNLTFSAAFAGDRIVYLAARDLAGGNSGWRPLGVWTVPGATQATTTAVVGTSPARGDPADIGAFTFTFSDIKGTADLGVQNILVNSSVDGRHACYLAYAHTIHVLYLVNDVGDGLLPGQTLDSSGSLANSQCKVSWSAGAFATKGNNLTLNLNVAFSAAFAGNRVFYLASRDSIDANNSGWHPAGTILIP